jgi:hypothetical protein
MLQLQSRKSQARTELRGLRRMLNSAVKKKLLPANPRAGVEFPVALKGLFRPYYVTWSEQRTIEAAAPDYLRNIENYYRNRTAHLQGADANEEGTAGSGKRGGLDFGFKNTKWRGGSAVDASGRGSVLRSAASLTVELSFSNLLLNKNKCQSQTECSPSQPWNVRL